MDVFIYIKNIYKTKIQIPSIFPVMTNGDAVMLPVT